MSLFAFYVTLPYSELSEFMPRYSLCEDKVRHILKKQLISKMEEKKVDVNRWMDGLDEWMDRWANGQIDCSGPAESTIYFFL